MEAKLYKGKYLGTTNVPNPDYAKEVISLVDETESMDEFEKKYWKEILPYMTDEQVDRLFNITLDEKRKLEELEKKFERELKLRNFDSVPKDPTGIIRDIEEALLVKFKV